MADVYKQSFKQNYTNNIELSIFNCGLERCAPGQTWGPGIRDHYLIHLVVSGKAPLKWAARPLRSCREICSLPGPVSSSATLPMSSSLGVQLGRLQRCLRSQTGGTAALYRHCSCAPYAGPGGNAGSSDQHLFFPWVRASG